MAEGENSASESVAEEPEDKYEEWEQRIESYLPIFSKPEFTDEDVRKLAELSDDLNALKYRYPDISNVKKNMELIDKAAALSRELEQENYKKQRKEHFLDINQIKKLSSWIHYAVEMNRQDDMVEIKITNPDGSQQTRTVPIDTNFLEIANSLSQIIDSKTEDPWLVRGNIAIKMRAEVLDIINRLSSLE